MPASAPPKRTADSPGPSPAATRLRAPSWRDPRLLIGLVLVAASVVLGARVVAANSDTELYLTAVHTLTPGTTVQEADLRSVHVNLGDAAERYLPATQVPPAGSIVVQTVREGELLPTQALGSAEDVRLRPLNLPVTGGSAEGMRPGDVVDIWVSVADSSAPGAYEQPEAVVESAIVRQIKADAARFGGGSSSTITVLVPQESVPGLLAAVANDAQIALVPVVGQQS